MPGRVGAGAGAGSETEPEARSGTKPGAESGTESVAEPEPGSKPGTEGPGDRSVGYHLVGYAGEYRIELIENGLTVI